MKIKYFLISLIVILAAFIRINKVTILPPSLSYDEVDIGYQAMIFNQNQTDYYGNKFPFHFHSFGDYQPSLQIYSVALIQKFTNNINLSVRLPSAVFGTISVLILFLITKSIIPSFLFAISPWAIHFSRIGFAVSGMILCLLLGICFWQKYLQSKKQINIYLTAFFYCLSTYFYSTAKFFIIIIAILTLAIWYKTIFKIGLKKLILPVVFVILLLLPLVIDSFNGKSSYRFSYISIFTLPHREQIVDTLRFQDASLDHPNQLGLSTSPSSFFFHNKYQLVIQRFVSNYINSFSSDFLFLKGDNNLRHGFGGHGLLYIADIIFVLTGLFFYFKSSPKNKISTLFLCLLVLSPIPYALTRDTDFPHATRLILMLPSIVYFSYLGIAYLIKKYPKSIFIVVLVYGMSFLNFWHYYSYHYPQESARAWNTGMEDAVLSTNKYQNRTIVFSDDYISFVSLFLFYRPYKLDFNNSLESHLKQITNDSFSGQVIDNKYYFGHVNWTNLSKFPEDTIYVLPSSEYNVNAFPSYQVLDHIEKKYATQEAFYIIKKHEN